MENENFGPVESFALFGNEVILPRNVAEAHFFGKTLIYFSDEAFQQDIAMLDRKAEDNRRLADKYVDNPDAAQIFRDHEAKAAAKADLLRAITNQFLINSLDELDTEPK